MRTFFWRIRRCWGMLRIYWGTCGGDWSSLAEVMLYDMGQLRDDIRRNDIVEDAEETAREINHTMIALRHLRDDDAFDYADNEYPDRGPEWAKRVDYWNDKWLQEFVDGMKRIQNWWD